MRLGKVVRVSAAVLVGILLASSASADRTAWTWGLNHVGQLGQGTTQTIGRPAEVAGLRDVVKVALGSSHGLALLADGTVWAWGYNGSGQLGDGTNDSSTVPVQVTGLSNVVDIAAGAEHSLALRGDGTVWAWGNNTWGQLGNGTQTNSNVPVQADVTGVRAIAAGAYHSLAISADSGVVRAWGNNDYGQLGDGTTQFRTLSVWVHNTVGIKAIAAGGWHSLALSADGYVLAWGNNAWGQLGDGTNDHRLEAVVIPDFRGMCGIAAGDIHSLAWSHDTAYAWGCNNSGQLGDGTYNSANYPIPIMVGLPMRKMGGGYAHSLAVDATGGMWAWGWGGYGELGRGEPETALLPVPVTMPGNVIEVVARANQSAAIRWETSTMAWGGNSQGQLGDGTMTQRLQPVLTQGLLGPNGAMQVSAGIAHTLAVEIGGAVWAWGGNTYGQLGTGDTDPRTVPVRVSEYGAVVAVAAGGYHSVGLGSNGRVYACGLNAYGQLGDGTNTNRSSAVQVADLDGVVAIAAGGFHTLALRSDGTVWAWGRNDRGQLGDGTTTDRWVPVRVAIPDYVLAIAAGYDHSLAVLGDGSLWVWGANSYGQLGDGTTVDRLTPTRILALGYEVTNVRGGNGFSLIQKADGTLWATGHNNFGQLGIGSYDDSLVPMQVVTLNNVAHFAAGGNHSAAVQADGSTWTWGLNNKGQLGDGSTTNRSVPGLVFWPAFPTRACDIAAGHEHTVAITSYALTSLEVTRLTSQAGNTVQLTATLTHLGSPLPGKNVTFVVDGQTVGSAVTDASGVARYSYKVPDTAEMGWAYAVTAWYQTLDLMPPSTYGTAPLAYTQAATSLYTLDRTGTVGENVILRAYLRRLTDNGWVSGRYITFYVDGTWAGYAFTDSSGRADLTYQIPGGPTTRTITAQFLGDSFYLPSEGHATLTAIVWATKMATFDRTARITDRTELKARLVRSDNVPIHNKTIHFYVDGTFVIARPTNTQGYASYPYYDVPDGAGAGARTIRCEWGGDDGYLPVSKTATLTVLKALPYIWVLPKSVPQGSIANLYALFRRLYDYKKQEAKTVTFRIDGTWVADVVTGTTASGEPGIARHLFSTGGLGTGSHTIRCEFAGDAWVDAGYGEATLTIY